MEKRLSAKGKIIILAIVCIAILTGVFFLADYLNRGKNKQSDDNPYGEVLVDLNEIVQLSSGDNALVTEKLHTLEEKVREFTVEPEQQNNNVSLSLYICCVVIIVIVFILVYIIVLRPFDELQDFAEEIANGNLDKKIEYKRVNMFGEFTWAFDHMRNELIRSRKCEAEAIENNKTVVATLSHDIKTPIASIRGYAEALTMSMDSAPERRERYAEVIMRKCDDVTRITNDMFLHSIHDLDKLSMKQEDIELSELLEETIESLSGNTDDICKIDSFPQGHTLGDRGRVAQVVENIITNSRKYAAGSKINVSARLDAEAGYYVVRIKDEGPGIPDEDMPFIFNKFYRGGNVKDAPGAGLGLYIVKFIMEQMGGDVKHENSKDGLTVSLLFKLI